MELSLKAVLLKHMAHFVEFTLKKSHDSKPSTRSTNLYLLLSVCHTRNADRNI